MLYVPRAQWGARAYRLPGGATQYAGPRRGVKVHYLGGPYSDRAHSSCAAYVRSIQDLHMDGRGWSDIGYSFVACTHRYVFEGRGLKRRNSANGNTTLNEQDYAVCALVGSSGLTRPTDLQLHGLRDAIEHCREAGPCGDWIGGHKDGYATSCPGDPLYAWVRAGAPRPDGTPTEEDVELTDDNIRRIFSLPETVPNGNPATNDATPKISAGSSLSFTETVARRANDKAIALAADVAELTAKVDALAALELTPEQIAAIAAAVTDTVGDAIADRLAARLAE